MEPSKATLKPIWSCFPSFGLHWVCAGYALAQQIASALFAFIWDHCSLKVNTLQAMVVLSEFWLSLGMRWVCAGTGNSICAVRFHLGPLFSESESTPKLSQWVQQRGLKANMRLAFQVLAFRGYAPGMRWPRKPHLFSIR